MLGTRKLLAGSLKSMWLGAGAIVLQGRFFLTLNVADQSGATHRVP